MTTKTEIIDNFIYDLMMPYITYLKITLENDNIYERLITDIDNNKTNEINLYVLMEIIKKKIVIE